MKKIIIIILSIVLIGAGIFIYFNFFGNKLSDEIEVDDNEVIETTLYKEETIDIKKKDKDKKVYDSEKLDIIDKKELTPFEKFEKDYSSKVNKHFKVKDPELYKTALSSVIWDIFVNNNWHPKESLSECEANHQIYFRDYVSDNFINTYSKNGILNTLKLKGKFLSANFTPTPDKLYVEAFNSDKDISELIYFIIKLKENKIDSLEIETKIDLLDTSKETKINELTYVDAIINVLFLEDLIKDVPEYRFNVAGQNNLDLTLHTNNYIKDNVYKYLGQWKDEKGFSSSWQDKFVNISIGVQEEDGNDYQYDIIVMFEEKDGYITKISFLENKKKLLGSTETREDRYKKELKDINIEIEKNQKRYEKEIKQENEFLNELDKVFNDKVNKDDSKYEKSKK